MFDSAGLVHLGPDRPQLLDPDAVSLSLIVGVQVEPETRIGSMSGLGSQKRSLGTGNGCL